MKKRYESKTVIGICVWALGAIISELGLEAIPEAELIEFVGYTLEFIGVAMAFLGRLLADKKIKF